MTLNPRIRVDNDRMAGYRSQRTLNMGGEIARFDVFDPADQYIGQVVYVARRVGAAPKWATHYGWRPAQAAAQSKLTGKVGAIVRLPLFNSSVIQAALAEGE